MCGIVGIVDSACTLHETVQGLKRLEYRGYDSSGVAFLKGGDIQVCKVVGGPSMLVDPVSRLTGQGVSIGHTRWATHGEPSVANAHPHRSHHVALVHNGIVENAPSIRSFLENKGYAFVSQTDTESLVHLLDWHYTQLASVDAAITAVLKEAKGHFAIACVFDDCPSTIVVARSGTPPLLIGYGNGAIAVSSDPLGLPSAMREISHLPSGTWARIQPSECTVFSMDGHVVDVQRCANTTQYTQAQRQGFDHYMLKEIHEQPDMMRRLLGRSVDTLDTVFQRTQSRHVTLLGCGTSFYAAWVGKYFLEKKYSVSLELASEFHYRRPTMMPGVSLALSQSGETADTLKAMDYASCQGQVLGCIVNVEHSALPRMCSFSVPMQSGPEIGVASTKAFTAQVWALLAMSGMGCDAFGALPDLMDQTIQLADTIRAVAATVQHSHSMLYVGRGVYYPIALEGALKMKELSYVHAEGVAAGELKHGTIALIDDAMPVVVVAPFDGLFTKTLSTLHEISARKGRLIVVTDPLGMQALHDGQLPCTPIVVPAASHDVVHPFLCVIVLQLLAYYTALLRGCSIDQPRNLAKSVTVE